mmetsp:Transcript_58418/g.123916  ORF Transcript_58418/g.123916 Transcript_58418/m.123916 type:complete len:226 (+) Transcript_58418:1748-2425(+)
MGLTSGVLDGGVRVKTYLVLVGSWACGDVKAAVGSGHRDLGDVEGDAITILPDHDVLSHAAADIEFVLVLRARHCLVRHRFVIIVQDLNDGPIHAALAATILAVVHGDLLNSHVPDAEVDHPPWVVPTARLCNRSATLIIFRAPIDGVGGGNIRIVVVRAGLGGHGSRCDGVAKHDTPGGRGGGGDDDLLEGDTVVDGEGIVREVIIAREGLEVFRAFCFDQEEG